MRLSTWSVVGCVLLLSSSLTAQEVAKFEQGGIRFDYPKGWKVDSPPKQSNLILATISNPAGSQVTLQIHPLNADPKKIVEQTEKSFRKTFAGKLVPGSDKGVKQHVMGSEREGKALDFEVAKGFPMHFELFAFRIADKKPIVGLTLNYLKTDAEEANKGFKMIANSLAISSAKSSK
jgi:hypothetical protein